MDDMPDKEQSIEEDKLSEETSIEKKNVLNVVPNVAAESQEIIALPTPPDEIEILPEKEYSIGEVELSIIKNLRASDEKSFEDEVSVNKTLEEEYNWLRDLTVKVPRAIKELETEFERILDESKLDQKEEERAIVDNNEGNKTDEVEEIQEKRSIALEMNGGIPAELQASLKNRQESLDLCHKMLKRLDRLFPQFNDIQNKAKDMPSLKCMIWDGETRLNEVSQRDFALKEMELKQGVEEIRNYNYHLLRQKRDLINELKQFFYSFFQRYFFPIIDGLDSGKKFFVENLSEWKAKFPDQMAAIDNRSGIYDSLVSESYKFLRAFYIEQIHVEIGEEFDEQRHEPFMVEEDKNLNNNQIKEVNLKGYQFNNSYKNERYIMRAPQVVVVKNAVVGETDNAC